MNLPTKEQIEQALTQVIDPELGQDIVSLGMVREIRITGGEVAILLALTIKGCPLRNYLQEQTQKAAAFIEAAPAVMQSTHTPASI
jgi:metal-sulfur cluster biosynthetic enzyme